MSYGQQDVYDQWAQKQEAMGRRVEVPILPIPEIYCDPDTLPFKCPDCGVVGGCEHGS